MTDRINVLDPITANQIAAGEVVERPSSVVKELVENSIDAGATRIEIEVARGGIEIIRVTDNGYGMSQEDAVLAFQRHATSKINTPSDLGKIATLGFRGEALPSIASVSKVRLLTREKDSLSGTEVLIDAGVIVSVKDVGCPVGTTIVIQDIFFNTPARQKFLKSESHELGQIGDFLNRAVLSSPNIAFRFSNRDKILLQTSGSGSLLESIGKVYGKEHARKMLAVSAKLGEISLEGYIGRPEMSRSGRSNQSYFINGRYIKSRALTAALAEGYHTILPANRYAPAVLSLHIPLNTVDVNVHPTKLEVRFEREHELTEFVAASVRSALLSFKIIPGLENNNSVIIANQYSELDMELEQTQTQTQTRIQALEPIEQMSLHIDKRSDIDSLADTNQTKRNNNLIYSTDSTVSSHQNKVSESASSDILQYNGVYVTNQHSLDLPEPVKKLPDLIPLGQIDSTYIAARGVGSLYIIDQHAAHERINYERIWHNAEMASWDTQMLLEPVTLELTNQELQLVVDNIMLFRDLGFLLEFFGGNTFLVRGVPTYLTENPNTILHELIDKLLVNPRFDTRLLREEYIFMLACRTSFKAGSVLNREEIEGLIRQLGSTSNPYTCPHGRPTIIAISTVELAKRFQRI